MSPSKRDIFLLPISLCMLVQGPLHCSFPLLPSGRIRGHDLLWAELHDLLKANSYDLWKLLRWIDRRREPWRKIRIYAFRFAVKVKGSSPYVYWLFGGEFACSISMSELDRCWTPSCLYLLFSSLATKSLIGSNKCTGVCPMSRPFGRVSKQSRVKIGGWYLLKAYQWYFGDPYQQNY